MENTTDESFDTLDKWNKELAAKLIPDTIYLVIYLIIGCIGNSVVICVYARRNYLNNEDRFFIPILAIFDLVACIVNCSEAIFGNTAPVKYNSDITCKLFWFLGMIFLGSSGLTLMLIAIQRYLKLCKPFGKQMNRKWSKIFLAISIISSILISSPCFALYGTAEVKSNDGYIKGSQCTSVTVDTPNVTLAYKAFLFLLVFGVLIVLIVLFSLIGRVLYRLNKVDWKVNFAKEATSGMSENSTCVTDDESISTASANKTNQLPDSETDIDSHQQHVEIKHSKATDAGLQTHKNPVHRVTLIFMIIAGFFVICFIPKLAILIWESVRPDFWLTLSPSELAGYRFVSRFYIVNNVINPFVYGFLDKKFRTECKKMMCRKK